MANKYWATGISGSSGSLALIDPIDTDGSATALVDGDVCDVVEDDVISVYIAVESAGASEDVPDIIIPANNAGDFWWKLVERIPQNTGMIDQLLYENMPGSF